LTDSFKERVKDSRRERDKNSVRERVRDSRRRLGRAQILTASFRELVRQDKTGE
jgi:hypothetical protein